MIQLQIQNLLSDEKCYKTVRELRWPDGVQCPHCFHTDVIRKGYDETFHHRRKYKCNQCSRLFYDLTNTVFSGHHQPLKTWIACSYLMGLNISNHQIAQELSLNKDDVHQMTTVLREGVAENKDENHLKGEVECDEVYIIAGHKGHREEVKKSSTWSKKSPQRCSGSRYLGKRKTPNLWND